MCYRYFYFAHNWKIRGTSTEAAILYNPETFEVDDKIATDANDDWIERVKEVNAALVPRTVALQGKVRSTNTNIIVISVHLFWRPSGYKDNERIQMSKDFIAKAHAFSNDKQMAVIIGGDWNCKVSALNLSENVMAKPDYNASDVVDRQVGITPGEDLKDPDPESTESEDEEEEEEEDEHTFLAYLDGGSGSSLYEENQFVCLKCWGSGCYGSCGNDDNDDNDDNGEATEAPKVPKLRDVHFFKWAGNVNDQDMEGLLPDRIYRQGKGGKHRPIISYFAYD